MSQTQYSAYKTHQRAGETVRETEAHALLSCANKLEESRREECTNEELAHAVRHNQQLWTVFQVALCEPDNPLPRDLKVLLLNLSRYVDKVSFRILAEGNRDLLRSLIGINRTIAKGLSADNDAGPKHKPLQPPRNDDEYKPVVTSA